jgi:hypothetical protein
MSMDRRRARNLAFAIVLVLAACDDIPTEEPQLLPPQDRARTTSSSYGENEACWSDAYRNSSMADCYDSRAGGEDEYSGGGGGGDGVDVLYPGLYPTANDENVRCADIGCKLKDAEPIERERVAAAIKAIRTDIPICARIVESANAMIGRQLQIWHNPVWVVESDGKEHLLLGAAPFRYEYNPPGPVMFLYSESIHPWTVAHEALHGVPDPDSGSGYHHHGSITELGMTMDETAKFCSGS